MKRILNLLCAVMALCWITSCSESAKDFYQYINSDNVVIVSADALCIMENAGFEVSKDGIEMPAYLNSIIPAIDRNGINQILAIKGIDPSKVILSVGLEGSKDFVALAKVNDKKALNQSLIDNDFDKASSDGYDIYTKGMLNIVVDDNMALMLIGESDDMPSTVNRLKKSAEEKTLASWQKDIIDKGNTVSCLLNFAKIYKANPIFSMMKIDESLLAAIKDMAFVSYTLDLKGPELQMNTKVYDNEGRKVVTPFVGGKIDKDMLKYASNVDFAAALFAFPDNNEWKESILSLLKTELGSDVSVIQPLIELMDGKFMASFGYDSVTRLLKYADCHYSVAIKAVKGKGADMFDVIKSFLNANFVPYTDNGKMIDINLGMMSPSLYIELDGDNVLFTSSATRGKTVENHFKASDFGSGSAALILQVPPRASNITFFSLPFGIDLKSTADDETSNATLKLTDTEGGLIENLLKTATSLN